MNNSIYKISKYTIPRLSPLLSPIERIMIRGVTTTHAEWPPIFIIGAPRTGSTILYQLLTNFYQVLYFDNLMEFFYRNIIIGFSLSHRLYKNNPHNCFKSSHGQTKKFGLHAPNELGEYWYRWFPKDRHFLIESDVSSKTMDEIRSEIYTAINTYHMPFLFKNMNAGLRLRPLSQIFPSAKFIFITRNPLYTAQSILKARKSIYNDPSSWWSLMPPNVDELQKLDPIAQVVGQIFFIEKQIKEDLSSFPRNHSIQVTYEDLLADYRSVLDSIASRFNLRQREIKFPTKGPVRGANTSKTNDTTLKNIKTELKKYDWDDYTI